jgi:hypothetical protein
LVHNYNCNETKSFYWLIIKVGLGKLEKERLCCR